MWKWKVKKFSKRWKKIILFTILGVFLFVALVIIFISPIAKRLIEKYDVQYTGREITMDRLYLNPFTGYIHFSNLKIYEYKTDNVFFSAEGLSVNVSLTKLLFAKTYELSSLIIDKPHGVVIQNRLDFNFTDLVKKFSATDVIDTLVSPAHFNIRKIKINDGEFTYIDQMVPVNYTIKKVNFKSVGKYWDEDSLSGKLSFIPAVGTGDVSLDFTVNFKTLDYRVDAAIHHLDLNIIDQYLKDLSNYGSFSANLDADLKAYGNFSDEEMIDASGKLAINDFHFGKNPKEDYLSYKQLAVDIKQLAPKDKKYFFNSVKLKEPFFKYEVYDHLDNVQRMFGKNGSRVKEIDEDPERFNLIIAISKNTQVLFRNFLTSDYKINSVAIEGGDFLFNDYSIREKFSAAFNPFDLTADSVESSKDRVRLFVKSGIKPFGSFDLSISMDPKNNKDFELTYKFRNIPAATFNPYLVTYTSFPLDKGIIEMFGNWTVRENKIASTNHFLAIDPRVTKRIRKKDTKWIPMPLIMSFVRERGDVIDYEIPITGDLKSPTFHFHDVIMDLIKNIFIKPPTTPYRLEVRSTENKIEKLLTLSWAMRQTTLLSSQENFLEKIADFLKDNPTATINVQPFQYAEKEKENILLFEAKKKYFQSKEKKTTASVDDDDSSYIDKMSVKDSSFIKFLDNTLKDSMLFTVQEKCIRLVGEDVINKKFNQMLKARQQVFMKFFEATQTDKQVKMLANENTIPFNGFSYFKISYNGDIPESLMKAYEKLDEINSESPRKKYSKFRKVNAAGIPVSKPR